jgi:hypothetical protein
MVCGIHEDLNRPFLPENFLRASVYNFSKDLLGAHWIIHGDTNRFYYCPGQPVQTTVI